MPDCQKLNQQEAETKRPRACGKPVASWSNHSTQTGYVDHCTDTDQYSADEQD